MKLVFLGAPGVGKGTLAALLAEKKNLVHISTGAILRKAMQEQTDLGKQAKSYMEAGGLVPDELVSSMVAERLEQADVANGYILDGYPRTLNQAEFLDEFLAKRQEALSAVVLVSIPDQAIIDRLTARVSCQDCGATYNLDHNPPQQQGICDKCGGHLKQRDDDKEDVIKQRLAVYRENTAPLIDYYKKQNLLVEVDNSGTPEEGLANLLATLA